MRLVGWITFLIAAGAGLLRGQTVIAAKAGLIHYFRGEVYVDEKPLTGSGAHLQLLKKGQTFRVGRGRAELVLHPGVVPFFDHAFVPTLSGGDSPVLKPGATLRLGEYGAVRMLDDSLEAPRVELLSGSAILDLGELPRNTDISIKLGDVAASVSKSGLYRFDAGTGRVSTYKGEARATVSGREMRLPSGFRVTSGEDKPARFNSSETDPLLRWSKWRAHVTAQANLAALKKVVPMVERRRRGERPW